jgi:hypothetical protein
MGQSKQRKAAVGVLSLAVAALVADKTLLGGDATGPRAAAAATSPVPAGTLPAMDEKRSLGSSTVTEWLREYSRKAGVDPQSTPDSFSPAPFITPNASEVIEPDAYERADQEFVAAHTLNSVILSSDPALSVVRVNGRMLRLGDTLDGYTLARIFKNAVGFQAGPRKVGLVLQGPKLHED